VLPTLCAVGWFYNFSGVPVGPFVLILASPLMLWLGESRFTARVRPWQGVIIRATFAALPVAAAVVWTMLISQAGADE
jgi:hypothetical protein